MWETWVWSLGGKDPLEKGMATHFGILAWRIPWTEEPGGLQSTGLQRVRHDWATDTLIQYDFCPYKRKSGHRHKKGWMIWRHREEVAICKPPREASEETNPTDTLILDFQHPELWENKFLSFKPPSLQHPVLASPCKLIQVIIAIGL